jgi:hypothetical protein
LLLAPESELQPLLLDTESDAICFASNRPSLESQHSKSFNVDFLVPAPLKIHESVYNKVDALFRTPVAPLSKTIRLRRNVAFTDLIDKSNIPQSGSSLDGSYPHFPIPGPGPQDISIMFHNGPSVENQQSAMFYYNTAIKRLGTYNFDRVDKFYWSAPSTLDYFSGNTESEGVSRTRAKSWTSLAAHLKDEVAKSKSGEHNDPCNFLQVSVTEKKVGCFFFTK